MPARTRLNAAARDALFRALSHPSGRVHAFSDGSFGCAVERLRRAGCILYRGCDVRATTVSTEAVPVYSLTPRGRRRAESIARGRVLRVTRAVAKRHGIVAPFPSCEVARRAPNPPGWGRLASHVLPWCAQIRDGHGRSLYGRLDVDGTLTFEGPFDTYGPRRRSLIDHVQVTITTDTATIARAAFGAPQILGLRHGDLPRWNGDRPRPPGACDHMTDLAGNMRITPALGYLPDPPRESEEVRVRTPDGAYELYPGDIITWRDGALVAVNGEPTRALIAGAFLVLASIGFGVMAVHAGVLGAHGTPPTGERS